MSAIERALKCFKSQEEFASKIGRSQSFVSQMLSGMRPVPPVLCIPIEEATEGKVTRYDLRPDVFGKTEGSAA